MREAMQLAKHSFGDSAIVLKSKKLNEGARNEQVEITVTSDNEIGRLSEERPASPPFYTPTMKREERVEPIPEPSDDNLLAELHELRSTVDNLSKYMRSQKMLLLPETMRFLNEEQGVEPDLASELVQNVYVQLEGTDVRDEFKVRRALRDEIRKSVTTAPDKGAEHGKARVICLVGPTGMGKTTSIIKLATHPEYYGKRKVGLITIDTFRVAAAAQLKTFAALAKLPLEIVYEPEHFATAVDKFRDRDVILVDTAGRSPLNQTHLDDLRAFFKCVQPDEIHLVVSVATHPENVSDTAREFSSLNVDRVIVSKIDETRRLGNILNVGKRINLPISFLTNGQRVPDDIHVADGDKIANLIVN